MRHNLKMANTAVLVAVWSGIGTLQPLPPPMMGAEVQGGVGPSGEQAERWFPSVLLLLLESPGVVTSY